MGKGLNGERQDLLALINGSSEDALARNQGKGTWRDTPLGVLIQGLKSEMHELFLAVAHERDEIRVYEELGDVCAAAAMLADGWQRQRAGGAGG